MTITGWLHDKVDTTIRDYYLDSDDGAPARHIYSRMGMALATIGAPFTASFDLTVGAMAGIGLCWNKEDRKYALKALKVGSEELLAGTFLRLVQIIDPSQENPNSAKIPVADAEPSLLTDSVLPGLINRGKTCRLWYLSIPLVALVTRIIDLVISPFVALAKWDYRYLYEGLKLPLIIHDLFFGIYGLFDPEIK